MADAVFCRLYTQDSVFLLAHGVNEAAYRVGAKVKVLKNGHHVCTGTVMSAPEALGIVNGDVIVFPQTDDTAPFFDRNPGLTLQAERLRLEDVLRLPKAAVRSESGKYYVYQYAEGALHRRYVQIGLEGTDPVTGAAYVQIIEGLEVGDQVTVG